MKKLLLVFFIVSIVTLTILQSAVSADTTFSKSENQTHYCYGFWGNTPTYITNVTSNSLSATARIYNGTYYFYADDWCAIVTTTNGVTSYWHSSGETIYYNNSSGQTTYVTQRTPYSVLLSPDWILLCANKGSMTGAIGVPHGYVKGSVLGQFDPPDDFTPLSTTLFEASTQINF
jgi:hypothetical protein